MDTRSIRSLILVHGEKPRPDRSMHPAFEARLACALALARTGRYDAVLVTGGPTRPGARPEAETARAWFADRLPIPALFETEARTTSENIRSSRRLLAGAPLEHLTVISSRRRMARIQVLYARLWPAIYRRTRFVGAPDHAYPPVFFLQEIAYMPFAFLDPRERTLARLGRRWFRNG